MTKKVQVIVNTGKQDAAGSDQPQAAAPVVQAATAPVADASAPAADATTSAVAAEAAADQVVDVTLTELAPTGNEPRVFQQPAAEWQNKPYTLIPDQIAQFQAVVDAATAAAADQVVDVTLTELAPTGNEPRVFQQPAAEWQNKPYTQIPEQIAQFQAVVDAATAAAADQVVDVTLTELAPTGNEPQVFQQPAAEWQNKPFTLIPDQIAQFQAVVDAATAAAADQVVDVTLTELAPTGNEPRVFQQPAAEWQNKPFTLIPEQIAQFQAVVDAATAAAADQVVDVTLTELAPTGNEPQVFQQPAAEWQNKPYTQIPEQIAQFQAVVDAATAAAADQVVDVTLTELAPTGNEPQVFQQPAAEWQNKPFTLIPDQIAQFQAVVDAATAAAADQVVDVTLTELAPTGNEPRVFQQPAAEWQNKPFTLIPEQIAQFQAVVDAATAAAADQVVDVTLTELAPTGLEPLVFQHVLPINCEPSVMVPDASTDAAAAADQVVDVTLTELAPTGLEPLVFQHVLPINCEPSVFLPESMVLDLNPASWNKPYTLSSEQLSELGLPVSTDGSLASLNVTDVLQSLADGVTQSALQVNGTPVTADTLNLSNLLGPDAAPTQLTATGTVQHEGRTFNYQVDANLQALLDQQQLTTS